MSMTYGGDQITFNDNSTQNTSATGFGFKNRIINGAMMIDQRNAGASVTPTDPSYTLDRWKFRVSQTSKLTCQRNAGSVTLPTGYTNYLGVTSSSAYSVISTDYFVLVQDIEGFNTSDLGFGTSSASTITLSFQVYSSLTGTFSGALRNSAANRSYPFTYTVSSANTWTTISITISGDTTGTWIGATNGIGLSVIFNLGCGSTYNSTAGSWQAGNYTAVTGSVSVVGTNGATFYITGVQLEKGSTATSFDYRPYGTELALCQRYYWQLTSGTLEYPTIATGTMVSTTSARLNVQYRQTMRATPTISITSGAGQYISISAGATGTSLTAITAAYANKESALVDASITGSTTAGYGVVAFVVDAAASIKYSAEL